MPAKATKNPDGSYKVSTPNAVHARRTTKANADSQVRLLNAIEHNPDFAKKLKRKRGGSVARPRA